MYTAGIDVGSITTKAAVMKSGELQSTKIILTSYDAQKAGRKVYDEILADLQLTPEKIDNTIATGYGRNSIDFATRAVTEITCHAAGAHFLNPEVRSVIDIGGQDSKAIVIDAKGNVQDFAMNDKCAAGTGRFLEVMARALEVELDEFGRISLKSQSPAKISSLCTVFAESEVISLIAKGEKRENIIAGIHDSIGSRVIAMGKRIGLTDPIMMTGGVAKNIGVVKSLESKLTATIDVSSNAQLTGAIGAALIASKR